MSNACHDREAARTLGVAGTRFVAGPKTILVWVTCYAGLVLLLLRSTVSK